MYTVIFQVFKTQKVDKSKANYYSKGFSNEKPTNNETILLYLYYKNIVLTIQHFCITQRIFIPKHLQNKYKNTL